MDSAHSSWAFDEFGHAELGDERRTARLVSMAAQAAALPGGKITGVFLSAAEREAAFRFVENDAIPARSIAVASHVACARRSGDYSFVFVPVDGSSLNISDWARSKGLGIVGARFVGARGLHVMTAIGVSPSGVPLGICGQYFWTRRGRARRRPKYDGRNLASRESSHWRKVMSSVRAVFDDEAPMTEPWFQLDRGGDAFAVLDYADRQGVLMTVRASYDRRLWSNDRSRRYLWSNLRRSPIRAITYVDVPASPKRAARIARLEIRFADVTLDLRPYSKGQRGRPAQFGAVLVSESGTAPGGEAPIEWLLLTTYPVRDVADAELVVDGYATRWTVEDFHRAWKSGVCRVEHTQLRDCDHIVRWATILAAVAGRALRLAKLSRSEPELPATKEFSTAEIEAVFIANRRSAETAEPTLGEVVLRLAELGGYVGKSSGGPPGAAVIARGLERIHLLAMHLATKGAEK